MSQSTAAHYSHQKQIMGHPAGLFVLFFAEMWERMSYYGMRALLVLYMVKYLFVDPTRTANVLGFDTLKSILEMGFGPLGAQPFASQIYGLYTGFVYLSPFFGGILADRVWGKRKSVYIGGALMAFGHFLMAFENLFLPALFFLILGNGAFKPNISTQVGALYKEGDSRRDGAFTIFYMGINLGAFFSPFLCKTLAVKICEVMGITSEGAPWHLGFAFAGVGMMLGLVIYHWGRSMLPPEDLSGLAPKEEHKPILYKSVGGMLGIMVGFIALLMLPSALKAVVIIGVIAAVIYAVKKITDQVDRSRVAALLVLCVGTIFFWAIFEQQGNTLQLWADEKADWARIGLDAEIYQSFNPAFIFIFAPLMDMWWTYRAARGQTISSVRKMGIGCVLAGVAFLIIPLASNFITVDKSLTNMFWLAMTTWVFTMGELYLSPIGLSLVTKVAPVRFMSMMMGVWFMSSFLGNYLAGALGGLYSQMSNTAFFMVFAVMGGVVGLFFFMAEGRLQKIIGHVEGGGPKPGNPPQRGAGGNRTGDLKVAVQKG
jgi:POT family proton-dependent oligopeptide transporter